MAANTISRTVLRPWLVVVGLAKGPITESNPLVRVVHRDNLDRAIEVMRNRGYKKGLRVFSAKTNLAAREWADQISEQQEAIAAGKDTTPLRRPGKLVTPIDQQRLEERVAPADDAFGYYNGHYAESPALAVVR
jgi:hypothetical protein